MEPIVKPVVYASRCLGFDKCRYNGATIHDDFIKKLKPHVTYVTACPEVDIGLGIPRDPVRIVLKKGIRRLVQPATQRDVTELMKQRVKKILNGLPRIDGFMLKSRSPSCGIKDTKFFPKMEKSAALGKGAGFFGCAVIKRFPEYPIEDEGRIRNFRIREHFLTRLFTLARFRSIEKKIGALVAFHTIHKILFMMYNKKEMKTLSTLIANRDKMPVLKVFEQYQVHLFTALLKPPRSTTCINVFTREFGYFSKYLTQKEKKFFLDSLQRYHLREIPLSTVLSIISTWKARFNGISSAQQVLFQPYPEDMILCYGVL